MKIMNIFKKIIKFRRAAVIILTPIFLIPLLLTNTKESKMGFVLILMAIYWATEVIPLATTGMIPLVLAPIFGILPATEIGPSYMSNICVLFMGSIMLALIFEHHNLHKKVALIFLSFVGSDPRLLLMGFMVPAWFLSMWITNTSVTAMMVPIVQAIMIELKTEGIKQIATIDSMDAIEPIDIVDYHNLSAKHSAHDERTFSEDEVDATEPNKEGKPSEEELYREELESIEKGFYLSVAYSASIGGIATLNGTPANFVIYGMLYKYFNTHGGLNFGTWMLVNLPTSFIILVTAWLWLALLFIGPRKMFAREKNIKRDMRVKRFIQFEKRKLGKTNFAQGVCIFFFFVLVTLWITRSLGPSGWSKIFEINKTKYATDSTVVVLVTVLLMMWPAKNPFSKKSLCDKKAEKVIMPWKVMQKQFPWGILFLIGGGLALADGCHASGLTNMLAKKLEILKNVNVIWIVIILTTITSFFTELTSNTATASVLLPIILKLAVCLKVNPLLLSLPVSLSTCLAFCLPVATPPNTIIFTKEAVKVIDMIKAGFVLNILSVIIINIATFTYVNAYFKYFEMPSWAGECKEYNSSYHSGIE